MTSRPHKLIDCKVTRIYETDQPENNRLSKKIIIHPPSVFAGEIRTGETLGIKKFLSLIKTVFNENILQSGCR